MLVRHGEARTFRADRNLACSLAAAAGALNAIGFQEVGIYTSHMTGTVAALAESATSANITGTLTCLGLVACFVAGSASSALLANEGHRRGHAGIYALSVLAEAAILAMLAAADAYLPEVHSSRALAYGLSFLMGLQNATVTRISNARVRTTHVTGMVTDIGIELGHLLDVALRRRRRSEVRENLQKLAMHVPAVLSFLAGAAAGIIGYGSTGPLALLAVSCFLLFLAIPGLLAVRREGRNASAQEKAPAA